jgi:glycosyltransferase involved in cell wall biosynthesis
MQRIVLSGVNLVDMGPMAVFQEAIASIAADLGGQYEIVAIVHRRDLFVVPRVTYLEYPNIKSSWLQRVWFEYSTLRSLSLRLKPKLWLSMHDITPRVTAEIRAVYCHNPAPFWRLSLRDALLDSKFGIFALLYRFVYRINIQRNDYVIVQQEWLRKEFQRMYPVRNVVVAQPSVDTSAINVNANAKRQDGPYRFFYPAFPRIFKNAEVALRAARILERGGLGQFELWLTFDASVNKYAAGLARQFSDLRSIRWLGLQTRQQVFDLYSNADCLLFPSKLESWGLPITEFKATRKPILAADLPYAHETVGEYDWATFFDPDSPKALAALMKNIVAGKHIFPPSKNQDTEMPVCRGWSELWSFLLQESRNIRPNVPDTGEKVDSPPQPARR